MLLVSNVLHGRVCSMELLFEVLDARVTTMFAKMEAVKMDLNTLMPLLELTISIFLVHFIMTVMET